MDYKRLRKEVNNIQKRLDRDSVLGINDYNRIKKLISLLEKDNSEKGIKYYEIVKLMLDKIVSMGVPFGVTEEHTSYIISELPILPFVFDNRANYYPHVVEELQFEDPTIEEQNVGKELPIYEYYNGDQFKFNYQLDYGFKVVALIGSMIKIVSIDTIDTGNAPEVKKVNNIQYLMELEHLKSPSDAISILLGVYSSDYEVKDSLKKIVKRYKKVLSSEEFHNFLDEGRRRAQERNLSTLFYDKMDALCKRKNTKNIESSNILVKEKE